MTVLVSFITMLLKTILHAEQTPPS